MANAEKITFGSTIKAARLRFGWSPRHDAYIRLSGEPNRWKIELAPPDNLLNFAGQIEYVMWWESSESTEAVENCEALLGVSSVTKPVVMYVDDEGKAI